MYDILHFETADGVDFFVHWLENLRDRRAAARVAIRIDRVARGTFGDHKSLGSGVWELRIDYGPGYRVYYAKLGQAIVLLLCGGDKRKQASDIKRAISFWNEFKTRNAIP